MRGGGESSPLRDAAGLLMVRRRSHDAMVVDPEFAQALLARNARRQQSLEELVARMAGDLASASAQRDAVDLIFALTSCAMFRMLAATRAADATCGLIKQASKAAVTRIIQENGGVA